MDKSGKLLVHYFFRDESHAMDAMVRNYCEREVLLIIKELNDRLGFNIQVESEALREGGLKELWKLLGSNKAEIMVIHGILTLLLSRLPVHDRELLELQKENLRLDNEIKRLELDGARHQLEDDERLKEEIVEELYERVCEDYRIVWHRSNFYKRLHRNHRIVRLSAQALDDQGQPTEDERVVDKIDFSKFVVFSDSMPPVNDEEAVIDIISPVLKQGNYTWKGIYDGKPITFEMGDGRFRRAVLNKEIEFKNGTAIHCSLRQYRKIDESGVIKVSRSKVLAVHELLEDYQSGEVVIIQSRRRSRKALEGQLGLFGQESH